MQTKGSEQFKTKLPKEVTQADLELATIEGFERRYLKYLETSKTYQEAYEKVAQDYREIFKRDKYTSYSSFRISMNRRLKSR